MKIRSRAPLRIGLAGGGTDVSPYCDEFGGRVLNATIGMYAYCTIESTDDDTVTFQANDLSIVESYAEGEPFIESGGLELHRAVYCYAVKNFNNYEPFYHKLSTSCDAPLGSGLGSSSTMVVAILMAYIRYFRVPLSEYEVAGIAYNIERVELGQSGGRQDQYAAVFGGINYIEIATDGRVIVNPLRIKERTINELESSILLYYTQISRKSHLILKEQIDRFIAHNQSSVEACHVLKSEALIYKDSLLRGELKRLIPILKKSWEAKKQLSDSICNEEIDQIFNIAMEHGALAGKISGAGGGGFIMFIVDPARRAQVSRKLNEQAGRVVPFHFTDIGAQAWEATF